jgi:hypothetical protein
MKSTKRFILPSHLPMPHGGGELDDFKTPIHGAAIKAQRG